MTVDTATSVWNKARNTDRPSGVAQREKHFSSPVSDGPDAWKHLSDALLNFYELCDDWDGNGAQRPDRRCIAAGMRWLQFMASHHRATPPSSAVPGSLGEVVFVWQRKGLFIEATIEDEMTVEWMTEIGDRFEHFTSAMDMAVEIE